MDMSTKPNFLMPALLACRAAFCAGLFCAALKEHHPFIFPAFAGSESVPLSKNGKD